MSTDARIHLTRVYSLRKIIHDAVATDLSFVGTTTPEDVALPSTMTLTRSSKNGCASIRSVINLSVEAGGSLVFLRSFVLLMKPRSSNVLSSLRSVQRHVGCYLSDAPGSDSRSHNPT